jgi:sugar O-acyltransferase (sialic acid O-acetyltransferase NeuD family)
LTGIPLVIIGAGGHGREIHDIVEAINDLSASYRFLGFIDDGLRSEVLLVDRKTHHIGGMEKLEGLPEGTRYVIAIGDGRVRRRIDEHASALGLEPATLIHPQTTLGRHRIVVGPGAVLFPHVSLTTNIRLGRHVHLNVAVSVGHDSTLHDYVTVNPGAAIAGNVTLETECTIGTGAAVIQGLTVGRGSIVGAGAAVVTDIPPGVVAVGVPARPRSDQ